MLYGVTAETYTYTFYIDKYSEPLSWDISNTSEDGTVLQNSAFRDLGINNRKYYKTFDIQGREVLVLEDADAWGLSGTFMWLSDDGMYRYTLVKDNSAGLVEFPIEDGLDYVEQLLKNN